MVIQKQHREMNRARREKLQRRDEHRSRVVQTMKLECLCVKSR